MYKYIDANKVITHDNVIGNICKISLFTLSLSILSDKIFFNSS